MRPITIANIYRWPGAADLVSTVPCLPNVYLGEGAEARNQRLGQRLHIAPRHGAEQDQLEKLIIGQRLGAALAEPVAQPLAVAVIMWRPIGRTEARLRITPRPASALITPRPPRQDDRADGAGPPATA